MFRSRAQRLVIPGGRMPGVDPSHPASRGLAAKNGLSAVAIGSNFINILTGAALTKNGTPGTAYDGRVGHAASFATTACWYDTGQEPTAWSGNTLAVILVYAGTQSGTNEILRLQQSAGGGNAAHTIYFSTPSIYLWTSTAAALESPAAGNAYFIAVSYTSRAGAANYVSKNLNTGQLKSGAVVQATPVWPDAAGKITIGNTANFGGPCLIGSIAAVMASKSFVPLPGLKVWAEDPWSFWYPKPRMRVLRGALGANSIGIGPGVYAYTGTGETLTYFQRDKALAMGSGAYAYTGAAAGVTLNYNALTSGDFTVGGESVEDLFETTGVSYTGAPLSRKTSTH